jgi:SAM-dependent methyltransferase/acyl carrier protein
VNPLEILFADGERLAERLYRESPFARAANRLLGAAVRGSIGPGSADGIVRVLEVGGGTGGATDAILAALPPGRTEYRFTDLSPRFVADAASRFAGRPEVSCRVLDLERSLTEQGIEPETYDLVVASNVLHATKDVRRALGHVRHALKPGGLLVLLEGTGRQRWVDLVFGLTDGWWHFTDTELRPDYPLLTRDQWQDALAATGFDATTAAPSGPGGETARYSVIVGRTGVSAPEPERSGVWLVFADEQLGPVLVNHLRGRGERCWVIRPAQEYEVRGHEVGIDPGDPSHYRRAVHEVRTSDRFRECRVVYLWGLMSDAPAGAPVARCADFAGTAALAAVQAAVESAGNRVWLVTRGVQPVNGTHPDDRAVSQAAIWGLGRVAALEHPEVWGGLIDLDPVADPLEAERIAAQVTGGRGEDQVAYREGQRFAPRLRAVSGPAGAPLPIRSDATYLITGGYGMLGLRVARWLADRGARHLVLIGRSAPGAAQSEVVSAIERLGCTVRGIQVDVADFERMSALVNELATGPAPLRGIVHAAGNAAAVPIRDLSPVQWAEPRRPKVDGAWVLHRATAGVDLDFFVLCSSAAAVWGSLGLAAYAAASAGLDALAHHRRALGLPSLSVNWGRFEEAGMVTAERDGYFDRVGIGRLGFRVAMMDLGHLLSSGFSQATVAAIDWSRFKPLFEAKGRGRFLSEVGAGSSHTTATTSKATPGPALGALTPSEARAAVAVAVREETAGLLGLGPADVNPGVGFFDLGMDSLLAIELKKRLEGRLGISVPSTLLFEYPTVTALSAYLCKGLGTVPPDSHPSVGRRASSHGLELDAVESLSDADVDRLLAQRAGRKE